MTAWVAELGARQRQALALALLLAALGTLVATIATPLWQVHARNAERIETLESQLQRFRAHAAERPALERRRAALLAAQSGGGFYLRGDKPGLAAAELQRLVKVTVAQAGAELVSSQILPAAREQGFQRIGLRARMRGTVEGLQETLYRLETGKPYLFVNDLRIRVWTVSRRNGPEPGDLDIYFDLHGYLAGRSS